MAERSFSTKCPKCGAENRLWVVFAKVSMDTVPLTPDGFSIFDANQIQTEDELVQCSACWKVFDLAEVTL